MILEALTASAYIAAGAYLLKDKTSAIVNSDSKDKPNTGNNSNDNNSENNNGGSDNPNTDNSNSGNNNGGNDNPPPTDSRKENIMYRGNKEMDYDPFYDYSNDNVFNSELALNAETMAGGGETPHAVLRQRIIYPMFAMANENIKNDDDCADYYVGILGKRYKSVRAYTFSGITGHLKFQMEIFNPANVPVPLYSFCISKITIDGKSYWFMDDNNFEHRSKSMAFSYSIKDRNNYNVSRQADMYKNNGTLGTFGLHTFQCSTVQDKYMENLLFYTTDGKNVITTSLRDTPDTEMKGIAINPKSSIYVDIHIGINDNKFFTLKSEAYDKQIAVDKLPGANAVPKSVHYRHRDVTGIVSSGNVIIEGDFYKNQLNSPIPNAFDYMENVPISGSYAKPVRLELIGGSGVGAKYNPSVTYTYDNYRMLSLHSEGIDAAWREIRAYYDDAENPNINNATDINTGNGRGSSTEREGGSTRSTRPDSSSESSTSSDWSDSSEREGASDRNPTSGRGSNTEPSRRTT